MSVPILTHCCHHSNKFTLSLKRESTNTSTHHDGQNLSEEMAGALLLETFKFNLARHQRKPYKSEHHERNKREPPFR